MRLTNARIQGISGLIALSTAAACSGESVAGKPPDDNTGAPSDYTRLPEPVTAFGARVLNDRLYVHGGHVGEAHDSSVEALIAKLRRLDLAKPEAAWEEVAGPEVPLQQSALFTHGDKLYRLGGMTAKNHRGEEKDLHTLGDFAVYDAAANAWHNLPPMPDTRASHDVVVDGSTVYVTGGWKIAGGQSTQEYSATWLSIDLAAPQPMWAEHQQPFRTRDHCGGVADGKIYVLGGMHSGMFPTTAQVYDPKTDTWSEGPALPVNTPVAGFGCAAASLNGTIYFSAAEGVVYKLNSKRDGWDKVAVLKVPRLFHRLVARNEHELIALGGGVGEAVAGIDSVESVTLP